ncbi:hypothetical protein B0H67DRAFT_324683 [Lasiosphaeris hirsuta]|uniref:Uncharacterized protein n=1 Tax=Lasiosphaeris hirsuta TaxID=260670 RepID=A0AA40DQ43_9PEZI|nr:hypothetical protein B0H67DRAFT_324683 [Lasiosphaeris hirsuta]
MPVCLGVPHGAPTLKHRPFRSIVLVIGRFGACVIKEIVRIRQPWLEFGAIRAIGGGQTRAAGEGCRPGVFVCHLSFFFLLLSFWRGIAGAERWHFRGCLALGWFAVASVVPSVIGLGGRVGWTRIQPVLWTVVCGLPPHSNTPPPSRAAWYRSPPPNPNPTYPQPTRYPFLPLHTGTDTEKLNLPRQVPSRSFLDCQQHAARSAQQPSSPRTGTCVLL